mmetsp:Transcript_12259/g.13198  ORF Transcript_12259/g.13198 Transcript_12259/m.13198 type:complete len:108 (-) Transcript_12259:147-470(-)
MKYLSEEGAHLSSLFVMNQGTYRQAKANGDENDVSGLSPFAFAFPKCTKLIRNYISISRIIIMMSCDRNSITYHMCAPSLTYINNNNNQKKMKNTLLIIILIVNRDI